SAEANGSFNIGGFKTEVPLDIPPSKTIDEYSWFSKQDLYPASKTGISTGSFDILMYDPIPMLNAKGQMMEFDPAAAGAGSPYPFKVTTDYNKAFQVPNKNILVYGRDLPGWKDFGDDAKKIADGTKVGVDYGGHYHEDDEVIYCPAGKLRVFVRENSGDTVIDKFGQPVEEKRHADAGTRKVVYNKNGAEKAAELDLTDAGTVFILERGGRLTIPGRAFHTVMVIEKGDLLAYLPDGKRWCEHPVEEGDPIK
ncbi:MAG: hypothetical protein AAF203_00920, partial [Pseudomonadota bacterium]